MQTVHNSVILNSNCVQFDRNVCILNNLNIGKFQDLKKCKLLYNMHIIIKCKLGTRYILDITVTITCKDV
jgi:hypothetical protein